MLYLPSSGTPRCAYFVGSFLRPVFDVAVNVTGLNAVNACIAEIVKPTPSVIDRRQARTHHANQFMTPTTIYPRYYSSPRLAHGSRQNA
jgi:hypothetical protein